MSRKRVIGIENQLPWHLPADLKHFKAVTMGKPIVMGRKTWESIGRPLPGRENIVISQQAGFCADGAHICGSVDEALALAEQFARAANKDEIMVIGGAQIYAATLPQSHRLYVTEVDSDVDGDAFYPELDMSAWREVQRECYPPGNAFEPPYCFVTFQRNRTV